MRGAREERVPIGVKVANRVDEMQLIEEAWMRRIGQDRTGQDRTRGRVGWRNDEDCESTKQSFYSTHFFHISSRHHF
jgi:hypothetical protein